MCPNLTFIDKGKKFMWDGQLYTTRDEASNAERSYQNDNFEVCVVEQEGTLLLYTRRIVKEVVVSTP